MMVLILYQDVTPGGVHHLRVSQPRPGLRPGHGQCPGAALRPRHQAPGQCQSLYVDTER